MEGASEPATDAGGRDYHVETSGRVLLPEAQEQQLVPALRAALAARAGRFGGSPTAPMEELTRALGVRPVRDDDHVLLVTDREGDTRWTEQSSAFYAVLADHTDEGQVRFRGEDGAEWALSYTPRGVLQEGVNGFDGSTSVESTGPLPVESPVRTPEPAASPAPREDRADVARSRAEDQPPASHEAWPPPLTEPIAGPPPEPFPAPERGAPTGWADDEPAQPRSPGRAFAMAALLLGGVFLIVMIAVLASGIG